MKKKKQKLNYPLLAIVIFSLISMVYVMTKSNREQNVSYTAPSYNPTQIKQERIYKSEAMKFSITVPSEFQIEETLPTVTVKSVKGEIHIDRSGTNFETLVEHLDNLSRLNHFVILSKQNIDINTLPAVRGIINEKRHYFIYGAPWTVYSIFTSSPPLFPDLDQIAQSFRYTP